MSEEMGGRVKGLMGRKYRSPTLTIISRYNRHKLTILLSLLLFVAHIGTATAESRIVENVKAEGSCAVVGMSAEQSQLMALQHARMAAIEQAVGIRVTSSTIVTNARLAMEFIRTYSKGFIVNEKVKWLPLGQYQKDISTPPVPEYRVKITADVYKPVRKIKPIGLTAKINETVFRSGENGRIDIKAGRKARIAIFNITADDKVVMLFPNQYERDNNISGGDRRVFPVKGSQIELVMQTLPGHGRDAEAFFVVAIDDSYERKFSNIFEPLKPMGFSEFFGKYSGIADYCEDKLLTYEVVDE